MTRDREPGTYRPTTLKYASKRCARAINHYHSRAQVDRRIFGVGIVVHAIIQAVIESVNQLGRPLDGEEFDAISMATCERMIREGRTFEGEPEPPMPADDVWAGRRLARQYFDRNPMRPAELAEVGMAVDHNWEPTEYSQRARLRLISDYITVTDEVDEESAARVLVVRDYKSAWPTDASELDTVQLRAQAVLAHKFHGEGVDCVRQEVSNLRTGATYTRELWLLDGGAETLQQWEEEIESTMRALDDCRDDDGLYAASPGGGCIGCPFLSHCEPGKAWSDEALEHDSAEERAVAYASLLARAKSLEAVLRQETEEQPVAIPGGKIIGTVGKEGRSPAPDAGPLIVEEWTSRGGKAEDLVSALGIGVTQINKAAKVLFPERSDAPARREWIETLTETIVRRRFGIHEAE